MMADPSKDLRDAASPARVLLSQSRQLAEQLQVRSAKLYRRPHELRRWHDGLHQSVAIWALPGCGGLRIITLTGLRARGHPATAGPDLGPRQLRRGSMKALLRDDFALILAGLEAWLSRLETTVPRLEDGLAGASRAELAGIAAELAGQVCELQAAADALTQAHQVDDLSVGVLPPDACAR